MQIVDEIPLLLMSIYLFRWFDSWPFGHLFLDLHPVVRVIDARDQVWLLLARERVGRLVTASPLVELL